MIELMDDDARADFHRVADELIPTPWSPLMRDRIERAAWYAVGASSMAEGWQVVLEWADGMAAELHGDWFDEDADEGVGEAIWSAIFDVVVAWPWRAWFSPDERRRWEAWLEDNRI